ARDRAPLRREDSVVFGNEDPPRTGSAVSVMLVSNRCSVRITETPPMALDSDAPDAEFGPWNPGLQSQIPDSLRHLSTIFRPENVFTTFDSARELRDLTGLEYPDLVAFRPERLALHELLVRVTADLSVPDGAKIEDLGINFRQMTRVILARYVEPRMDAIRSTYDDTRKALEAMIDGELSSLFSAAPPSSAPSERPRKSLFAFMRPREQPIAPPEPGDGRERRLIDEWHAKAHS